MRNFYLDSQRYEVVEKLLRVTGERAMRAEVLDSCSAKSRNNALSFAIAECQEIMVERLLDRGCDVNTRVLAEGIPLLCLAISNVASHLIDPEATTAARNIVDKLLRHEKIKLFAKMADGRSALSLATEFHLPSVVQFLVTHGADVNERRLDGVTPLSCAVYNDDIELTQILIDGGAYCDTVLPNGQLLIAMTRNKVIKNLLENGISRGQTRSTII
jgi:ankyrin repeat protein